MRINPYFSAMAYVSVWESGDRLFGANLLPNVIFILPAIGGTRDTSFLAAKKETAIYFFNTCFCSYWKRFFSVRYYEGKTHLSSNGET